MPWQYAQKTGQLKIGGVTVSVGYSGKKGLGRNDPSKENIQAVGPIPKGRYRIGKPYEHASKGPVTMALAPIGHTALGRTHFLIHGDGVKNPGDASEGCIVLDRKTREAIAKSDDTELVVIEK